MKRVKRPHGLLPKVPEKGAHITVVLEKTTVQARVRNASGGRQIQWRESHRPNRRSGYVYRRDEGTRWARGWDTPEANALCVAVSL